MIFSYAILSTPNYSLFNFIQLLLIYTSIFYNTESFDYLSHCDDFFYCYVTNFSSPTKNIDIVFSSSSA